MSETNLDTFGEPVACDDPSTVELWNEAWDEFLHFNGDAIATLAPATASDEAFVLGPVMAAAYTLLAGARSDKPELLQLIALARQRQPGTRREQDHLEALEWLIANEWTKAADTWAAIAAESRDMAALRLAHDAYLHVGNIDDRLRSSERAVQLWDKTTLGWNHVLGMHSFSLEEAGRFDEAEQAGWESLEADPEDLWALHALAHVFESRDDQEAALELLDSGKYPWQHHDNLTVHVWWHLALRLIEGEQWGRVLAIYDAEFPNATTAFRLTDFASLLWRMELNGVNVGDRWEALADATAKRPEKHTAGFLDLHAAMTFSRLPSHSGSASFFAAIDGAHDDDQSENGDIFRSVVSPLVSGIRSYAEGEYEASARSINDCLSSGDSHRIGGSNAQRDILVLTATSAAAAGQPS